MSYQVLLTETAKKDLDETFNYICLYLQAPKAAIHLLDNFQSAIMSLGDYPHLFSKYTEEPWLSRDVRVMPIDHYKAFYQVNEVEKSVIVLRVLYEAQQSTDKLK